MEDASSPLSSISQLSELSTNSLALRNKNSSSQITSLASAKNLQTEKDIANAVAHSVLSAQKRSSEFALSAAIIASECELKRTKLNSTSVENERNALALVCKSQTNRLESIEMELADSKQTLQDVKQEYQLQSDNLIKEINKLQCLVNESDSVRSKYIETQNELVSAQAKIVDLKFDFENSIISQKKSENNFLELQSLFNHQKSTLAESVTLKSENSELKSKITSLQTELQLALRGPGNASSLINRPDGSGLLRSSSLLHTTGLENKLSQLQAENLKLINRTKAMELLECKNKDLTEKLSRAEEWRNRAIFAEEKLALNQATNSNAGNKISENSLAQLQRENALLLSEQGQLRTSLLSSSTELKSLTQTNHTLALEVKSYEANLQCLDKRCRRQNRKIIILEKERDVYKQFVDSYNDADATLASPTGDIVSQFQTMMASLASTYDMVRKQMDSEIEELDSLRNLVTTMSNQTNIPKKDVSSPLPLDEILNSSNDKQTLNELRNTIGELNEKLDLLTNKNEDLKFEIECLRARGAFNPDETRVIHLNANPVDQARKKNIDELVELRKDNAQLTQRVQILQDRLMRFYDARCSGNDKQIEQNISNDNNITLAIQELLKNNPDPLADIEKLKNDLKKEKWRGERLMETFKLARDEFRDACRLLFGFTLQVRKDAYTVQLSSRKICLKFKRSGNTLQLIDHNVELSGDEEILQLINASYPTPTLLANIQLACQKSEYSTMFM